MFTQTSRIFCGAILFFITSTLTSPASGFAQSFHHSFHSVRQVNALLDSLQSPHMEVTISQPDKNRMKFRIAVLNPANRSVTITIIKQDDVYFSETVAKDNYENLYDFSQLDDGDYQVLVTSGKEKIRRRIVLHTETRIDRQASLN